jgi:hypothetical protein
VVLALKNNGKVVRRGVGKPPWKLIVEEFTKESDPKKEEYKDRQEERWEPDSKIEI